jgi:hypothetical protein
LAPLAAAYSRRRAVSRLGASAQRSRRSSSRDEGASSGLREGLPCRS